MRRLSWSVLALAAMLVVPAVPAAAAGPIVRTDQGQIKGTVKTGFRTFEAVPYAAPPTGERRWRAPQPVTAWRGVRDATAPHERCAQNPVFGAPTGDEDCLYLNVTAPTTPGPHPVLVFLHGGSFQNGSATDYDPARLATHGDLVVITVNYRLGVLGYFGLPGLAGSGTFGLQDQQAALRWVRHNAAAFGGDPRNVTLDGESAGAESVCAQLTSPSARGLFDKAIMQSGSCLDSWPDGLFLPSMGAGVPFTSRATVERNGSAFAATLGCPPTQAVACLRGKDPLALLGATRAFTTPAYGTALLPDSPAVALRAGRAARVPVLSGTNLDEHRAFTGVQELWLGAPLTAADYAAMLDSAFGDRAADVAARYPAGSYETPGLAWAALATDRIWACPSLATRRLLARHAPAFGYEFAERHSPAVSDTYPWGAAHGYELPYLFDVAGFTTVGDVQANLADDMIDAWSRFAATGRPGWAAMPAHRVFAADRDGGVDLAAEHQCGFWAGL
ncbi:carboxylesterase/lipase family protein [Actinoplanes palleronii]|uniref:Carboxylic ester hydrolase n=1 Tax=Actinoplanes palleronii TaxID=113570 RepID=A0ABQ4BN19_9ACTN|nr:carboxylesterase family protein [Actinoplanes palleronii]GIE72083.1 carboxylic ester hydrolase [Actinoplanes palleronii]